MKTCSKCGELKIEGNFFKDGSLCGHCWKEETPDWYPQLMREVARMNRAEREKLDRKHRLESARVKIREYKRQWSKSNPKKVMGYERRRRTLKSVLAYDFTLDDESRALDYWNGRCAVCDRPLIDLFGEHYAAMDHWIALSDPRPDNPGTVPTNMIPLCHGVGGCNNKKGNRDPVEWLIAEFGKRKSMKILERIETYFEWAAVHPGGKVNA